MRIQEKAMKKYIFIFFTICSLIGCQSNEEYDLVIHNAKILNVKTGIVKQNQTILIKDKIIKSIVSNGKSYSSKELIDANGKLLSPGFIDTHIHPTDVFGDYENAPKYLPKDSLDVLRLDLSKEYLPFGTTTVLTMGQPENWLKSLIKWQKEPNPNYVDFYLGGGALISKDNRTPYIAHTEVISEDKAKQKISEYNKLGIKHVKLYFRLKEPELSTILKLTDSLKMQTYGHIGDFNSEYLKIGYTLEKGLINYEHIATLPNNIILKDSDWDILNEQFNKSFGSLNSEAKVLEYFLAQFRFLDENRRDETLNLINKLAERKSTFSTTIHRIYEQIEPTYFTSIKDKTLTNKQRKRSQENFEIMLKYLKLMSDKGIELRLASDMPNGGKVNVSELIILCKYGFSVADAFRIATLNGAKSLGIENEVGTIEKGKKANLILWEKNPFENYQNFKSEIIVIKGGKIHK